MSGRRSRWLMRPGPLVGRRRAAASVETLARLREMSRASGLGACRRACAETHRMTPIASRSQGLDVRCIHGMSDIPKVGSCNPDGRIRWLGCRSQHTVEWLPAGVGACESHTQPHSRRVAGPKGRSFGRYVVVRAANRTSWCSGVRWGLCRSCKNVPSSGRSGTRDSAALPAARTCTALRIGGRCSRRAGRRRSCGACWQRPENVVSQLVPGDGPFGDSFYFDGTLGSDPLLALKPLPNQTL